MEGNMGNRVWHQLFHALLCSALFLLAGNSQAASLGKIEVASHLGEPFFAEVPLKLEANELPSKVFVEIAAPADYKIFEVYRDPIVKSIRADVASDARGARVELSSRSRIQAPFFNLVLKIRYGRVSHFKKFPVFLDVPKAVQQAAQKAPQPAVAAVKQPLSTAPNSLTKSAGQAIAPAVVQPVASAQKQPTYYQGWARTDRYGPIVKGDSLSIVAERLRVDYRYTRNQIMLALFEKNRADFEQGNMNLMKAGSFLKVPTAAEIEKHSKLEATRVLAEHEKAWKKLTRQPRYAAEAEAQRTRYSKRISIGEHADGVAAAPTATAVAAATQQKDQTPVHSAAATAAPAAAPAAESSASTTDEAATASAEPTAPASTESAVDQALQEQTSQTLIRLQEQNEVLKQQLIGTQKSIEDLSRKVAQNQAATVEKAHIKKLEMMIAGLQSELKQMHESQPAPVATGMNWMVWLLIALVVLLLGVVAILMRREPAHPAAPKDTEVEAPDAASERPAVQDAVQSDSLTSVIEHEVAGIETGETPIPIAKETATIDSLPAFTDELSDTDTAELEPFDADNESEPDPDIDYVSEADVYIRYGMEDEALKQLDMALRLQPDNVEAHIKKAELLLGKSDREGFDATIAAATMTLTAVDLGRFKSFIEGLGEDVAQVDAVEQQDEPQDVQSDSSETVALESSAADGLDFDFAGLDAGLDEIGNAVTAREMTGELELPDLEGESTTDETVQFDGAVDQESEEMPWLHDEMFDADAGEDALLQAPEIAIEPSLETEAAVETEAKQEKASEVEAEAGASDGFDVIGGATQELDNLLSEFSDQGADEPALEESESGATRHLDQLLSEFDDDEDEPFDGVRTVDGLDESFFEPAASESVDKQDDVGVDTDHGATQELDNLLSEFSNEEDDLLEIAPDFSDLDDVNPADRSTDAEDSDSGEGATQVLGRLLDEFTDEESDDEEDAHKKG